MYLQQAVLSFSMMVFAIECSAAELVGAGDLRGDLLFPQYPILSGVAIELDWVNSLVVVVVAVAAAVEASPETLQASETSEGAVTFVEALVTFEAKAAGMAHDIGDCYSIEV